MRGSGNPAPRIENVYFWLRWLAAERRCQSLSSETRTLNPQMLGILASQLLNILTLTLLLSYYVIVSNYIEFGCSSTWRD